MSKIRYIYFTLTTFYSIYSYIMASFPSSEITSQTPRTSLKRLDVKLR